MLSHFLSLANCTPFGRVRVANRWYTTDFYIGSAESGDIPRSFGSVVLPVWAATGLWVPLGLGDSPPQTGRSLRDMVSRELLPTPLFPSLMPKLFLGLCLAATLLGAGSNTPQSLKVAPIGGA